MAANEAEERVDGLPPNFSKVSFPLPTPKLTHDFRLACTLQPKIPIGPTPAGGQRNWIIIGPGWFSATWAKGTVVPGGQDNQIVSPDDLSTYVSTNYLLKTTEPKAEGKEGNPAYITVHTEGWRTGPREVMEALFDPARADSVTADRYSFFLSVRLETGDERYKWVSKATWIARGARRANMVVYDAYRVE
jgi:hypothetical protein